MTQALLEVRGLVKRYGGLVATDRLDLSVRAGEIHALIGPNGAGKTTLIQQLSGALTPDAGGIVFDGADVTALSMHERVRRGLARSYQITSIFTRLSVLDNVALALQARSGGSLRFWAAARAEAQRYEQAAALLGRVGLGERLAQTAGALSHGEQRQLEVGIALATGARLLLLDEPMAGMGPEESERMVALLQGLRGELTLLLVEHDMDAVFRLADTLSVLVAGRIIASGAPALIRADAEVRRAYLGDDIEEGA
ncbi:MAG: ABC transporter ATP-binding protein [Burkholderiales bacterium]|nr:ABC transporter ATP-binding protein [Burkholderiales bacterium]